MVNECLKQAKRIINTTKNPRDLVEKIRIWGNNPEAFNITSKALDKLEQKKLWQALYDNKKVNDLIYEIEKLLYLEITDEKLLEALDHIIKNPLSKYIKASDFTDREQAELKGIYKKSIHRIFNLI